MTRPPERPGDQALSPRESLALIDAHQNTEARRRNLHAALLTGIWGLAYLISWGAFYLNGRGALPMLAAGIVTGVLIIGAMGSSAWLSIRDSKGVRGPSQVAAGMYGWSWTLGFLGLVAVNIGLQHRGLSGDQVALLWSGSTLLLVGVLYLVGGAMFHSWPQYAIGAWMLISGVGSVYAGVPGNFMVLALAGGGGFLLQSAYYGWRGHRGRTNSGRTNSDSTGADASLPAT